MKIISTPPTRPRRPRPPWRTMFVRPGTIAEHDGVRWVLVVEYAWMDSYKVWKRL